ncbi:MAG: phage virion morphogenesis protein [Comamonas sp.]
MSGVYSVWGAQARGEGYTVQYGGGGAILQHLRALERAGIAGFVAARREIGEYLLGEVQDNVDGQRLFDGSPMPQSRAARERKGKTLIDRHHLYDSYVYQLTRDGVEVGSALVYSAIHHFGGMTGRGKKTRIEARPVLGMGPEQEREVGELLLAELGSIQ